MINLPPEVCDATSFSASRRAEVVLRKTRIYQMILKNTWLFPIAYCDAAEPWQLGFQDAATPMMQGIIECA